MVTRFVCILFTNVNTFSVAMSCETGAAQIKKFEMEKDRRFMQLFSNSRFVQFQTLNIVKKIRVTICRITLLFHMYFEM